jgi:6-pyruvoyl-tetrahydropterin synthase
MYRETMHGHEYRNVSVSIRASAEETDMDMDMGMDRLMRLQQLISWIMP